MARTIEPRLGLGMRAAGSLRCAYEAIAGWLFRSIKGEGALVSYPQTRGLGEKEEGGEPSSVIRETCLNCSWVLSSLRFKLLLAL